jgi:hypothetical protein
MNRKNKLLYIHIPKTAGVYLSEYITEQLGCQHLLSDKRNDAGVWTDYTLEEVLQFINVRGSFLHTHTLAFGWHDLCYVIPAVAKDKIIDAIQLFKQKGWFVFSFVRHPGDVLCSFYHYVYNFYHEGLPHVVAAHAPVVDRTLDDFVAEHCQKELFPDYWTELDFIAEASDATFRDFFKRYLDHDFQPGIAYSHASGSRGYRYYCEQGLISSETQRKLASSVNMQIYQEIIRGNAHE